MSRDHEALQVDGWTPEAVYEYESPDGVLVGAVARFAPGSLETAKTFRQFRHDGSRLVPGLGDMVLPLYRLPEVIAAVKEGETIIVVEGEKCVEALEPAGHVATTCSGGARKWRQGDSQYLAGADVVILPDNDEAGRRHAELVARSLEGIATRVRVLDLPGLGDKEDIADWLPRHDSAELLQLLNRCEDWVPSGQATDWPDPQPFAAASRAAPFEASHALPPGLAELATGIARAVQVDVAGPGVLLPVVLSAAAGNAFSVRVSRAHAEPNLSRYAAVGAGPGERKSAMCRGVIGPLDAWASERGREWKRDVQAIRDSNEIWEKIVADEKKQAKDQEPEEVASRIVEMRGNLQAIPSKPLAYSSDVTMPKLVRLMEQGGGCHAVISADARDVVDNLLGAHRRDRHADDAVFLKAHGGDRLDRGRVTDDEHLVIERPALAVGLCVQMDKLRELAARSDLLDSGLLPRLGLCCPPSLVGRRFETGDEQPLDEALEAQWQQAVVRLLDWRLEFLGASNSSSPVELNLDKDARRLRLDFANELERRQALGGNLAGVAGFASKAAGEAARLAALFQLFEDAVSGRDPRYSRTVSAVHWRFAERHQRWQLDETLRVLGMLQEEHRDRLARKVLEWAAEDPAKRQVVASREVIPARLDPDLVEAQSVTATMELLAERGWVRPAHRTGKQRSPRWEFHPRTFQRGGAR